MPKSLQVKANGHLHDIWQAETKAEANVAFDFFIETYGVKYKKAVAKMVKDRDVLLAFYGLRPFLPQTVPRTVCHVMDRRELPAEHWKHIRTTVRHRTGKTKGCLSRKTGLAMAFKLMMSAQGKWQKLNGATRMPEIIQGIALSTGSNKFKPPPDHAITNFRA